MDNIFKEAFEEVMEIEGGYVNHEDDRGGATKYGITERVARQYGYEGDMRDLTVPKAKEIYRVAFWERNGLDRIDHEALAGRVFSFGINAGMSRAVRKLQEGYNLLTNSSISEDGVIGPETLKAVNNFSKSDRLLDVLKGLQVEYYLDIVRNKSSQRVFLAGWLNRVFEE
jgi:lysozyme family protein